MLLLLYCFVDLSLRSPDVCLYKCKELSIQGTISSVVCQNITTATLLLYCGPVFPPPTYACTRSVKSLVYTVYYHMLCLKT